MTVTIQLSDEQAATLRAKAEAHGLSLEGWLQSLAEQETMSVVDQMRSLRAHIKPDPEGWTTRDYVNYRRRSQ